MTPTITSIRLQLLKHVIYLYRLAALDLLRAEQLRAYTAHLAVHGPLFPPAHPHTSMPSQTYPPPHQGQANLHHQYRSSHHHHQQQHSSGLASSAMPSSSSAASSSSASKNRGSSRSPSLSHSTESRLSSPDMLVRTPDDERRMSGLSLSDSKDAILLPPPNMSKRKSPSAYSGEDASDITNSSRPAKRISPDRQTLPSISDILPSSTTETTSNESSKRATSPRSLQHILNQELRPLSMSNYRAQTSDVRSSSSSDDEDELAE